MEKSWIKYLLVFVLFCSIFLILKCKSNSIETDNSITTERQSKISENLPSSFIDFYERFHNEEDYQMEHIVFPLSGHQQDTATMELIPAQWDKENWVTHKPFNSYGGTFKRDYTNIDGLIIEKISDTSRTFSMQRRYSQIAGEWNLIYYSTFQMKPE